MCLFCWTLKTGPYFILFPILKHVREVPRESRRKLSAEDQSISILTPEPMSTIFFPIDTVSNFEGVAFNRNWSRNWGGLLGDQNMGNLRKIGQVDICCISYMSQLMNISKINVLTSISTTVFLYQLWRRQILCLSLKDQGFSVHTVQNMSHQKGIRQIDVCVSVDEQNRATQISTMYNQHHCCLSHKSRWTQMWGLGVWLLATG